MGRAHPSSTGPPVVISGKAPPHNPSITAVNLADHLFLSQVKFFQLFVSGLAPRHTLCVCNLLRFRPSGSGQGNGRTTKLSNLQQGVLGSLDEAEERPSIRPAVPPSPRHSGTSPRAAAGNAKPAATTSSAFSFEEVKSGATPRPVPPVSATGVGAFFPSPRTSHAKAEATTRPAERANSSSPGHSKKPAAGSAVQV